ncbi:TPA: HAD-IC family P-type ATPase, partial [Streptococcus suis]|nr:HAD-IC family P-type ATPase [Streptococcus suis]
VLQLAASSEQYSEHPLAQALLRSAEEESIPLLASQDFQALSGRGLSVTIAEQTIYLGNERLMREQGIDVSKGRAVAETFAHQAKTPVFLASQQEVLAVIAIADKVKETSRQAVQALQTMELEVVMLTGDNEKTAQAIAKEVGIEQVVSQVLPDDKANQVKFLQEQGKTVAMVGDYDHAFGKSYGVLMREWNLLARAVFVLNADNEIVYVEYLDNVNEHPDYKAALEAVK